MTTSKTHAYRMERTSEGVGRNPRKSVHRSHPPEFPVQEAA